MRELHTIPLKTFNFNWMKKIVLLSIIVFSGHIASAQSDVTEFIKAGSVDASKMIQGYLKPFAYSLGDGLNNGWYYTAETHDRFGFDFSMSITAVRIPESAKTFDLGKINLQNAYLDDPTNSIAQTVAGAEEWGPKINILDQNATNPGDTLGSFHSPPGIDMDNVPIPMAQLSFGLLPHTDFMFRYVPNLHFNQQGDEEEDVRVGLIGIGVKNSFRDWMPVLKNLPFDAAVFAAYSHIDASTGVDFQLEDYLVNKSFGTPDGYQPDENQELDINTNTMKIGLIVSKKIAFITFFGGIGNSSSKTTVDLLGCYPVAVEIEGNQITEVEEEVDPIKLNFESSRISLDAGLRMKLGFFNVFGSINKAEYTSLNAGVSLSVR